VKLYQESPKN